MLAQPVGDAPAEHRALPVDRVRFFDMPRLDVSSSLVRRYVAAGRPIRHLVPEAVERYIADAGLYRAEATA